MYIHQLTITFEKIVKVTEFSIHGHSMETLLSQMGQRENKYSSVKDFKRGFIGLAL